MSGFITDGDIHARSGQFGISITDNLTAQTDLWGTYSSKPHRYLFTLTGDQTVVLPEIRPETSDDISKALVGHSIIIANNDPFDTLTVVNINSPAETQAILGPGEQTLLVAESDSTQTWRSTKSVASTCQLTDKIDIARLSNHTYNAGDIAQVTANSDTDSVVQKWLAQASGVGYDITNMRITIDSNDDVIVSGNASSGYDHSDFDGTVDPTPNPNRIFVAKLNGLTGEQIWYKTAASTFEFDKHILTANGDIIVCYFNSTFDNDFNGNSITSISNRGVVVAKLSNGTGEQLWFKFTQSGVDARGTINLDADGNIIVFGRQNAGYDFEGNLITSAVVNLDIFIAKLQGTNGSQLWFRMAGTNIADQGNTNQYGQEEFQPFVIDSNGDIILSGSIGATTPFIDFNGNSVTTSGGISQITAKINGTTGSQEWVSIAEGEQRGGNGGSTRLILDSSDNPVLIGTFGTFGSTSISDFNGVTIPITTNNTLISVVAKLDGSNGSQLWYKWCGNDVTGAETVSLMGIFNGNEDIIVAGYIDATGGSSYIDYEGNSITAIGGEDIFIAKLDGTIGTQSWFRIAGTVDDDLSDAVFSYRANLKISSEGSIIYSFRARSYSYSTIFTDFEGNTISINGGVFISSLNNNGEQLWITQAGNITLNYFHETPTAIEFDNENNIIACGALKTYGGITYDFSGNELSGFGGYNDVYLARLNVVTGEQIWFKLLGSSGYDPYAARTGCRVQFDSVGNIFVGTNVAHTASTFTDFAGNTLPVTNYTTSDYIVVKLSNLEDNFCPVGIILEDVASGDPYACIAYKGCVDITNFNLNLLPNTTYYWDETNLTTQTQKFKIGTTLDANTLLLDIACRDDMTLNDVYQLGEGTGNIVKMNSTDGPIILRNSDGSFGSMFKIDNVAAASILLDVNTDYFAAAGALTDISGTNGIVMGLNADITAADNSVAIGVSSTARFDNSIAIGNAAEARSVSSIAIGDTAVVASNSGSNNIAIGSSSIAGGTSIINAIAIGTSADALEDDAIAIGQNAQATGENAIAIGGDGVTGTNALANQSIALGFGSIVTDLSDSSISIGKSSLILNGDNGIAIGSVAFVHKNNSISIGNETFNITTSGVAVGDGASLCGSLVQITDVTIVLPLDTVNLSRYFIIYDGTNIRYYVFYNFTDGSNTGLGITLSFDERSIQVDVLVADMADEVATKTAAAINSQYPNNFTATSFYDTVTITNVQANSVTDPSPGITAFTFDIGQTGIDANYAVAIGRSSKSSGTEAVVIGNESTVWNTGNIAIGAGIGVTGEYGIAIGSNSIITGNNSAIISPTNATITNEATNSMILSTLDSTLTLSAGATNNGILTKVFSGGERWAVNVSSGEIDYTRANKYTWGANEVKTTSGNVTNDKFTSTLELLDCYSVMIKARLIGAITDCDVQKTWSYTYHTNATNSGSPPTIFINPLINITATENIPSLNSGDPLVFTVGTDLIEFGITTTGLEDSPADVIQWVLILEAVYNKFA